jgi:hypothetical protein
MSFKITRAAIHNPNVTGTHKLVLIIIADHEGGEFGSWPSIQRIADIAGLKRRHTQSIIKDLETMGEVLVVRQDGHHGTNRYFVVNKVIHRGAVRHTGGAPQHTQGVHHSAPEHIRNSGHTAASGRAVMPKLNSPIFNTPQGEAPAVESQPNDTPNYVPPRCLHNVSQSALKCKLCKEAFMKGELE